MLPFVRDWPDWFRSLITDFVEGAVTAVLVLDLAIPGDLDQAKAEALVVGTAIGGALVAAVRRAAPGFIGWIRTLFGAPSL